MANTMKFGNGQWATKKDSILAFNDENANFKPLPFTASRASTATVVNKAGLLETVASGIPRVDYLSNTSGAYLLEPSSTNLITQSEAFGNSYWAKSGASIEGDASTAGSEKVVNGDFETNTTGWGALSGGTITRNTVSPISGSADLKFIGASGWAGFSTLLGTLSIGKTFELSFTYRTVGGARAILKLRPTNESTGALISGTPEILLPSASVNTTYKYIYTLGETSPVYLVFTDGSSGSATEMYIDNVSIKEVQGFASPSASSPLGAFKLVASTTTDYISATAISTGNNNITVSYFVKADTLSNFSIVEAFYFGTVTNFDLSLETSDNGKIEKIGNGWYRCSASYTYGVGQEIIATQLKTGAIGSIYIFGAQLEAQSYPTSYIPTAGSAITRLADTASQTVPDGVIGQTVGGVVYMDFIAQNSGSNSQSHFWMGSAGSEIGVYGSNPLIFYSTGGVSIQGANLVTGERYKIALAFETNDYAAYVNGVQIGVDLSATYPNMSSIYLNSYNNGTEIQKKKINDFRLYNTRLSNSELVKLTTI